MSKLSSKLPLAALLTLAAVSQGRTQSVSGEALRQLRRQAPAEAGEPGAPAPEAVPVRQVAAAGSVWPKAMAEKLFAEAQLNGRADRKSLLGRWKEVASVGDVPYWLTEKTGPEGAYKPEGLGGALAFSEVSNPFDLQGPTIKVVAKDVVPVRKDGDAQDLRSESTLTRQTRSPWTVGFDLYSIKNGGLSAASGMRSYYTYTYNVDCALVSETRLICKVSTHERLLYSQQIGTSYHGFVKEAGAPEAAACDWPIGAAKRAYGAALSHPVAGSVLGRWKMVAEVGHWKSYGRGPDGLPDVGSYDPAGVSSASLTVVLVPNPFDAGQRTLNVVADRIADEKLHQVPGEPLVGRAPLKFELSYRHGVSRMTHRHACALLDSEHLICEVRVYGYPSPGAETGRLYLGFARQNQD